MTLQRLTPPSLEEYRSYAEFAAVLARDAGKAIMQSLAVGRYGGEVETKKNARDLVSQVDRAAEEIITDGLRAMYPDHAWVAEESGVVGSGAAPFRWLIDPLDGTTNFLHGHPMFAVSIALEKRDPNGHTDVPNLVAATVHAPYLDETFYAFQGGGAYLNSQALRLRVSKNTELSEALLSTGFSPQKQRFPNGEHFMQLAAQCRAMRRCGSAALDLAYAAAGRYDAFWEFGLQSYDVAAGALLVKEAGGEVLDAEGGQDWLWGQSIVAGASPIVAAVRQQLQGPSPA